MNSYLLRAFGFQETARALLVAGAELIINPTMTPTADRDIETVMVQATAAQLLMLLR